MATLAARRELGSHRRHMSNEEAQDLNRVRRLRVAHFVVGTVDTSTSTVQQSVAAAMSIVSPHLLLQEDPS
jgi:hypothetical protein